MFIQEKAFKSVICEIAAILSRPQWVNEDTRPSGHISRPMVSNEINNLVVNLDLLLKCTGDVPVYQADVEI